MRTTRIILSAALLLSACAVKSIGLGDEPSDQSDGSESSEGDGTSEGELVVAPFGAQCDHDLADGEMPESVLLTYPTADCAGDLCLYADAQKATDNPCETDADCNRADPDVSHFVCDLASHSCELGAEYLAGNSFCTEFCENYDDCSFDGPTACQTGFSCEPQSVIGAAGCRPVCVCNDDLDFGRALELAEDCEFGFAPACEQNPGQGLCPG